MQADGIVERKRNLVVRPIAGVRRHATDHSARGVDFAPPLQLKGHTRSPSNVWVGASEKLVLRTEGSLYERAAQGHVDLLSLLVPEPHH